MEQQVAEPANAPPDPASGTVSQEAFDRMKTERDEALAKSGELEVAVKSSGVLRHAESWLRAKEVNDPDQFKNWSDLITNSLGEATFESVEALEQQIEARFGSLVTPAVVAPPADGITTQPTSGENVTDATPGLVRGPNPGGQGPPPRENVLQPNTAEHKAFIESATQDEFGEAWRAGRVAATPLSPEELAMVENRGGRKL